MLAATPVVRLPSGKWTPEAIEDVALALEALPPAARDFPGGPLTVSPDAPWDPADARAQWRLGALAPEQQERLWRRRAVVHAIIRRWDDRYRWSGRAGWQHLTGWGGPRPLIGYPWAYSRKEGLQSAAMDLATFAEELLVPAESIVAGAVKPDDQVRCRELSKSRFLDERLTGLDPSWKPARACPAFDAWASPETLDGFEVGFTAPSSIGAQSVFGHLFLTLVRKGEENPEALQLAALIAPFEARGLGYIGRGLTGAYRGVFILTRLSDVRYESLELEQRSLRRFRLALDADQRLRLLERVWEMERVGYVDYRFFDSNCASMLRFLLAPALGDDAPPPPMTPWETPAQVLEALGTRIAVPLLDEATGERARRVGHARRALVAHAPDEARAAIGADWVAVQHLDVESAADRARAYAALGRAHLSPDGETWRARVLLTSLRIERYALDVTSVARIRAEQATVQPDWDPPTTDQLIAARQARYQKDLSPRRIASDALGELVALDAALRAAPRRPFEPHEQRALDEEKTARATFDAASDAIAGLPDATLDAVLDEERTGLEAWQAEAGKRTVPESGYGRAGAGIGLSSAVEPIVRLRLALLGEELGDQRERGFGSRAELHIADAVVDLAGTNGMPRAARVTAVGIASLGDSNWGWGGGLDYAHDGAGHETTVHLERLWAFAADQRLTNFALASLGVRLGGRSAPSAFVLEPRLQVSGRLQLPGSFGNCLRLDAGYAPRLVAGQGVSLAHGLSARARLEVRVGAALGFALTARVEAEGAWVPGTTPSAVALAGIGLD